MSVLIIGTRPDVHVRSVMWALAKGNVKSQLVDYLNFPSSQYFSYSPTCFNSQQLFSVDGNGVTTQIDIRVVRSVWCRRMQTVGLDYALVHDEDLESVKSESIQYIKNIWYLLNEHTPDASWVNPIRNQERARSKAVQLKCAKESGFEVPDTIMTNNPNAVRKFYKEQKGKIIMKPFFQNYWTEGNGERYQVTAKILPEHLRADEPIKLCPGIYQELIERAFELRVVVFGSKILAIKLDSQYASHTQLDWRLDVFTKKMPVELFKLNSQIESNIKKFMARLGLRFGSLDLMVKDNGDIVFLEVNEQGQFLFLEAQNKSIPMLSEFCKFIAAESGIAIDEFPSYHDYLNSNEKKLFNDEMELENE